MNVRYRSLLILTLSLLVIGNSFTSLRAQDGEKKNKPLSGKDIASVLKDTISIEEVKKKHEKTVQKVLPHCELYTFNLNIGSGGSHLPSRMLIDRKNDRLLRLRASGKSLPDVTLRKEILKRDIPLKNEDHVRNLVQVITATAYPQDKEPEVKRIDDSTWHVYTGEFINHRKGFVINATDDGKLKNYEFDLKLVKKEG